MELNYLEEFIVLANRLNFTKTADELHLAQSTLSKHMSLLEADLSAQLFCRVHSQVELTEEGFFFLGVATGIVNEYRNAQSTLKTMVARKPISIAACRVHSQVELTEEGFFFLGVATGIVNEYRNAQSTLKTMVARKPISIAARMEDPAISGLLSIVASLAAPDEAPITFSHAKDKPPLDLIVKGDLDVLVDLLPARGTQLPGSIARQFLFSQPFVAIMDPANPLAERGSLSMVDLKDSTLVQLIWENTQPGWQKIEELCHQNGFEPKVRPMAVRSQAEAIAMLPQGCVLLYPAASRELRFLDFATNRVLVPITDECAVFVRSQAEAIAMLPQGCVLLYPAASRELRFLDFATNRVLVPITDECAVFSIYAIYREDRFEKLSRFFAHLDEAAVKMGFKED